MQRNRQTLLGRNNQINAIKTDKICIILINKIHKYVVRTMDLPIILRLSSSRKILAALLCWFSNKASENVQISVYSERLISVDIRLKIPSVSSFCALRSLQNTTLYTTELFPRIFMG